MDVFWLLVEMLEDIKDKFGWKWGYRMIILYTWLYWYYTPQLWGLHEASLQQITLLEGCVVSTSLVSIFTTFDHQLGRCIPGWWDSLWRSSGGTYGTLGADRCAGCAHVGRHLSVGKTSAVGLMKKMGYHLVSPKVEWFFAPLHISVISQQIFFLNFVWWQSSVPGLLHPFIYIFLEKLDRLRSIQAWPLHFTFEDSTHPTLAPDAFAALRADGSVHCWGGFFSGGHLGAMRQELYQAGKVMEVLGFKLMNIVEKKNQR